MQKGRTRARHVGGDGGGKTQDSSQKEEQKDKGGWHMDVTSSMGCRAGQWWEAEGCGSCGEWRKLSQRGKVEPRQDFSHLGPWLPEQTTEPGARIFACHI